MVKSEMEEMLQKFTEYREEYRKTLSPEKLFMYDFIAFAERQFLVYGYTPTQEQMGYWLDEWIEAHPELKDKLFTVVGKQ